MSRKSFSFYFFIYPFNNSEYHPPHNLENG